MKKVIVFLFSTIICSTALAGKATPYPKGTNCDFKAKVARFIGNGNTINDWGPYREQITMGNLSWEEYDTMFEVQVYVNKNVGMFNTKPNTEKAVRKACMEKKL